jgi:hypothetical protein
VLVDAREAVGVETDLTGINLNCQIGHRRDPTGRSP